MPFRAREVRGEVAKGATQRAENYRGLSSLHGRHSVVVMGSAFRESLRKRISLVVFSFLV